MELDVDFELTQPWTVLFGAFGQREDYDPAGDGWVCFGQTMEQSFAERSRPWLLWTRWQPRFVPADRAPVRLAGQMARLFPHMTVRENIMFGARLMSDGTNREKFADAAIDQFHLGKLVAKVPAELSGGERHRVAIARTVTSAVSLTGGAILLLDEPFTGLDVPLRDSLIDDLRRMLAGVQDSGALRDA